MAVVTIMYGGVDITSVVLFSSCVFDSQVNGRPGVGRFRIRDETGSATYAIGADILVTIDGEPVWAGWATVIKRVYVFPAVDLAAFGTTRFFDIVAVDLNILFQRRIVFNQSDPADIFGTLFPVGTPDTTAIEDLLANFLDLSGDDLDTTSDVHNVGDITIDQEGRAWQGSDRWGDAMTSIARLPGAIFYIRPNRTLSYVDDDTADAPIAFADISSEFFSGYREMEILVDGTGLANDVLGWGVGYGSNKPVFQRVTDTDSVDYHGRWQTARSYFGVFKQDTLDANVNSIVFGSPENLRGAKDDKLAVTFTTYVPGLLPGMKVEFLSEVWYGQGGISDVTLPVRKMTIRFPAPDTPRYDLVLSHEIDTPFDIIDNLLFDFRVPPFPPPPPPPPPPFPPAPVSCGITDTFNRATTTYAEGLGIADCGRPWTSGAQRIAYPFGRAQGPFDEDTEFPVLLESSLPGSWPAPFLGTIVIGAADNYPGFTFESTPAFEYPTGLTWIRNNDVGLYFNGLDAVLPAISGMQLGQSAIGGGTVFTPFSPIEIVGHIRLEEASDPNGIDPDDYVNLTFALGDFDGATARVVATGPLGDGETILTISGVMDDHFPAFFWRDTGQADFRVTYTGGLGGTIEFTVGPCTVSKTLNPGQTLDPATFGISNGSVWLDDPNTNATLFVEDPVTINDQTVEAPFAWQWQVEGQDVDGNRLLYTLGYTSFGGVLPSGFPTGHDTGAVAWVDPINNLNGVVGPFIMARIEDPDTGAYAVAWEILGGDLGFPFALVVQIDQFHAALTIGGATVSAFAADAIDPSTGDSEPLGLLVNPLGGDLIQTIINGQGSYTDYDDLNVQGVNACTEGLINIGVNWLSTWFTADGTQDTFVLAGPFLRGTAAVYINGYRQRQVIDYIENPAAGSITFSTPPAVGSAIVVSYYPAS